MVSLIKRFSGNVPQSERRPAVSERTDKFLDKTTCGSPFKNTKLDLGKIVALKQLKAKNAALLRDKFQDTEIQELHFRAEKTYESPLRPTLESLEMNNNNVFGKTRLQGISEIEVGGASGRIVTPLTARPVFEEMFTGQKEKIRQTSFFLPTRRNSCNANIRVTPLSSVIQQRRYSSVAAKLDEPPDLRKLLGAGGFGSVYMGMVNYHMVAIKQFHGRTKNQRAKAESFRAEDIAKSLSHPNIVRVFGTARREDIDCVIMEYVGDMNLQQILNDPDQSLDLHRRIHYILDLVSALKFIHEKNFVHLDVKPANILVTPYDSCKLGDFGCCQVIENGTGRASPTQRSYLTGTFAYRAPELLRGDAPTTCADVYSFGITLWQIINREQPYRGQNQHVVVFGVVAYNLRPDSDHRFPEVLSSDSREHFFQDIYVKCWDKKLEIRPTAQYLDEEFQNWKKNFLASCD